jgi:predicted regulator of amino acid metabolism with ACT domain
VKAVMANLPRLNSQQQSMTQLESEMSSIMSMKRFAVMMDLGVIEKQMEEVQKMAIDQIIERVKSDENC